MCVPGSVEHQKHGISGVRVQVVHSDHSQVQDGKLWAMSLEW